MQSYKNYTHQIGALISNLNSLEFVIRAAMYGSSGGSQLYQIENSNEGQKFDVDILTSYDALGEVIELYNETANDKVNKSRVLRLRDAFAHGRIFAREKNGTRLLVKFSKPKNQKVILETKIRIDNNIFKKEIPFVRQEIDKVMRENSHLVPYNNNG